MEIDIDVMQEKLGEEAAVAGKSSDKINLVVLNYLVGGKKKKLLK